MKPCKDMREFMERLKGVGELATVEHAVDPRNFELSSLVRHMEDGPNGAILFANVKGFDIRVVANLYGSVARCLIGCGIEPSPEEVERYKNDSRGSPGGLAGMSIRAFQMDAKERSGTVILKERIINADDRAARGDGRTKLVKDAPCKEVIITKDIDLLKTLPIPWHCDGDAGPFINPGALVQKDPDTGILNIGLRRHQVTYKNFGKNKMGADISKHTDGWKILEKYERQGKACEVALVVGMDPITQIMACYSSPHLGVQPAYGEFEMVGAFRGYPLEMVKCETLDLEVPASSEIVIEAIIPPNERIDEGPMAEFTDMYALVGPQPFMEVTAITHRKDPTFHTLMSGRSEEHRVLGMVSIWGDEESVVARTRRFFPSVVDAAILAGSHGFHLVVSMKKRYQEEDRALLHHLLATTYHKFITVVDDDIDVRNSEQVTWACAMRAGRSPTDYVVVSDMYDLWGMDPVHGNRRVITKLGVLATSPFGKPYKRSGPPDEMLAKMRKVFEGEVLGKAGKSN